MTHQEPILTHARSAVFGGMLFIAFVAAGSAYIVWAKLFKMPAWQVTTLPLVLMILYAAILALARYFRLRDDQAGDNLYYLGFLYTLTSLGVTLWQFNLEKSGGDDIVTNFGVAIASTILGVALRVVFNQMRQDPVEVERVARLELADAARRVKTELDATTFEFSSFRRALQQVMEENVRETRVWSERVAKAIFDELEKIPERSAAPLQMASDNSRETIEKLAAALIEKLQTTGQKLTAEEARIAASTTGVTSSLQELDAHLKAMKTPEGIIEIKLQPFIRGFTKAVKDQSDGMDARLATLQQVITQFDQSVQGMSASLAQAARERATEIKEVRESVAKTQNIAADTHRLLTELARRSPSPPPEIVERPGQPGIFSGWFKGGSS